MAVTDPNTRLERLLSGAEPGFVAAYLDVLKLLRQENTLTELAALIEAGNVDQAFRNLEAAAARLGVQYSEVFRNAADDTAKFLTREVSDILISFDSTNVRAVGRMQENQLRLAREFSEAQRRATREALTEGIRRGENPRAQARRFRNSIGLTRKQQQAVDNYRRALEELDSRALRRELRDRRFDPTVRSAIRNQEPLSREQIEKMVTRYRERSIKHRAEVIARTESLRSVHEGVNEMYNQALEAGSLSPDQLQREWNTAGDERVRDFGNGAQTSHVTMQGQIRGINEPFTSGAGSALMNPGDPSAPAFDTIQCRCTVGTRILSLEEIPGAVSVTVLA